MFYLFARSVVFLALVALAGCNVSAPDAGGAASAASAPDLVERAKVEYRAGHYDRAESLSTAALKLQPDHSGAMLVQAAALDRQKKFDRADVIYRKLFPKIGKTAAFNNNYGYSMLLRGNLVMARKYFLQAQAAAPDDRTVTNNLEMVRAAGGMVRQGS